LHSSGKLEPHLEAKYQQALELLEKFMKAGQSSEEAFQNASDLILPPAGGLSESDNPPEPLPLKEQEAVYKKLEAIDQAQRRMDDARRRRQNQNQRKSPTTFPFSNLALRSIFAVLPCSGFRGSMDTLSDLNPETLSEGRIEDFSHRSYHNCSGGKQTQRWKRTK
jgi:hypothetical protein